LLNKLTSSSSVPFSIKIKKETTPSAALHVNEGHFDAQWPFDGTWKLSNHIAKKMNLKLIYHMKRRVKLRTHKGN
jgi:hypothetical protein